MAITATMFQSCIEVKFAGPKPVVTKELAVFKRAVSSEDRKWMPDKGVWILRNPTKYCYLRFVRVSLAVRRRQPALF